MNEQGSWRTLEKPPVRREHMGVNLERQQHPPADPYPAGEARAQALRHLLAGFLVILILLGLDSFVGGFGASSVQSGLADLTVQEHLTLTQLEAIQKAQLAVASVQSVVVGSAEADHAKLQALLLQAQQAIAQFDFAANLARRFQVAANSKNIGELLPSLDALLKALSQEGMKLNLDNSRRANAMRTAIADLTWRQSIEDRVLLAACLLVSCLFLLTGTRVYYRMSRQSEELSQVSWQLLEKQELLAQRLSRELHDELGQSLTALKTNFSRHAAAHCVDPAWMQDCTDLLKSSIRSAHEISELLRPTLLDDFGLDSALSWLCERFEERNKIKVRYVSDYHWRLDEQAETHVFRIAQEALTNVAKHSEASAVDVSFSKEDGLIKLKIRDNGVGMKKRVSEASPAFGLTGMRVRARSLEGEMHVSDGDGRGVSIEVSFPAKDMPPKTAA